MSFSDLFHEGAVFALLAKEVWPVLRSFLTKEGGEALKSHIEKRAKRSAEESRVLIFAFFRAHPKLRSNDAEGKNPLDELLRRQKARQNLASRIYGLKEPYRPVDEETMMNIMAAVHETITEEKARVDFFYWLFGLLDDELFDGFIKAIENDQVLQWLKAIVQIATDAADALKNTVAASRGYQALKGFVEPENLERIVREGLRVADDLDQEAAGRIQAMRENYPRWMKRHR